MLRKIFPCILSAGLFIGCYLQRPLFNPLSFEYEEVSPPQSFKLWWNDISECSGLFGDFEIIKWFRVKNEYMPCNNDNGICNGGWKTPHEIYLSNGIFFRLNFEKSSREQREAEIVVKHEMLHDLLDGGRNHPAVFDSCQVRTGY
jgi:hypothetical protein